MRIAFIIFNNMTSLDMIGVFDPITRLKTMGFISELSWQVAALTAEVHDTAGLCYKPDLVAASLHEFDAIILPGGIGTRELVNDQAFLSWLATARNCRYKFSVCTGSLLLGASGWLKDLRATTHPSAFNELAGYCREVLDDRIVDEGDTITARGVTSSIDLGLYLCKKFAGEDVSAQLRRQMDYQG